MPSNDMVNLLKKGEDEKILIFVEKVGKVEVGIKTLFYLLEVLMPGPQILPSLIIFIPFNDDCGLQVHFSLPLNLERDLGKILVQSSCSHF